MSFLGTGFGSVDLDIGFGSVDKILEGEDWGVLFQPANSYLVKDFRLKENCACEPCQRSFFFSHPVYPLPVSANCPLNYLERWIHCVTHSQSVLLPVVSFTSPLSSLDGNTWPLPSWLHSCSKPLWVHSVLLLPLSYRNYSNSLQSVVIQILTWPVCAPLRKDLSVLCPIFTWTPICT